jgi:hypothetical protein
MRTILTTQTERTATLQLLSERNQELDLYRQDNGDGPHPVAAQFKLRAMRYPEMFNFVPPDRVQLL